MSTTAQRISLARATDLAARIVAELAPCCERIEVAGSIRRRKPTIGDVELVAIPRMADVGLFPGEHQASLLEDKLKALAAAQRFREVIRDGPKWKTYRVGDTVNCDVFIVTPETWGVQFALRTGSGDFSKSLVTLRHRGGRLDPGLLVRDGRVYRLVSIEGIYERERPADAVHFADLDGGWFQPLATPEERDFLQLAGGWVDPWERT